jgi:hypothetical protein
MSHPFCGTELVCEPSQYKKFPDLGWESWNRKAIYVKTKIDHSVSHREACGAAIEKWNEQVGARFFMTPDEGDVSLTFFERGANEWPFTVWRTVDGNPVWGIALNYDKSGTLLGINPGGIARSEIYVNRDIPGKTHAEWINVYAHEMGHSFGLADHQKDDINSVMSYQRQGRKLHAPSWEDVVGIANIYGLKDLTVRPADLTGIENIISIWHYDRYGVRRSRNMSGWRMWLSVFRDKIAAQGSFEKFELASLKPFETYLIKAKREGLLGFGRFELAVFPSNEHHWWEYR